jgi:hypothetical protein
MAMNDWDGDGKITPTDDFFEYMIYKDCVGEDDGLLKLGRRPKYRPKKKSMFELNAELEREKSKIVIPDREVYRRLREKYSESDIKAAIQWVSAPKGKDTMYTHSHMLSNVPFIVIWIQVILLWIPLIYVIRMDFSSEEISAGTSLFLMVLIIAEIVYMIGFMSKLMNKILSKIEPVKEEYQELYDEVYKDLHHCD